MESIILYIHIYSGLVGIASGFLALLFRKGALWHRRAGTVFIIAMPINAAGAALLGYLHNDINDVNSGILTIYLILTGWMAAKRGDGKIGRFEITAFLIAAAGIIAMSTVHIAAVEEGTAIGDGIPGYIFICVVALAALLDLKVIVRGGISGRQRITRHLWRMHLGLFIAVGSFFLGQMQVFPEPLRKIQIVSIPVILVMVLMIFWVIRVRFTSWWKH